MHVLTVMVTGLLRNMNHIVLGTDETGLMGLILGLAGLAAIVAACWIAHRLAWKRPRLVQQRWS